MSTEETSLGAFAVDSPLPAWQQVYAHIKQKLIAGGLSPGARLPATKALAAEWQTHDRAVDKAMQALVREGYLERRRPAGTFVRERSTHLACVGLYYPGTLAHPEHHFVRAVHGEIKKRLHDRDLECRIWMDGRPEAELGSPLPQLLTATQERAVDAVVAPLAYTQTGSWIDKLPVPVAVRGSGPFSNRVTSDYGQFINFSLDALRQMGCSSAGLIASISPATREQGGTRHEYADFFVRFVDAARDRGLELRSEWIVAPAHEHELRDRGISVERLGYEYVSRLLNGAGWPDGLIVTDDIMARGVVIALLEQRVHVPDDLKLVLHKNEEVDLVCPFPAAFVVTRASDYAAALLDLVERQFRGEPVEPVRIGWRLDMSGTTKQSAETRR